MTAKTARKQVPYLRRVGGDGGGDTDTNLMDVEDWRQLKNFVCF